MYRNLFLMAKLEFPSQKTYNLTYMITFRVSDLYTWIRTAASRIQQLPSVQKFIFDDKIGIPIPKNITFDIHDHFLGKCLYTWIRTTASRIQQLPGVQKFIFYAKFGFFTKKHIIHMINFGVNDLYTWIRLAPSRIQEQLGVIIYDLIL